MFSIFTRKYIYGLKSSGEVYINYNEDNLREIGVNSLEAIYHINGIGLIINNKQYILICETNIGFQIPDETISYCQLIDYENNHIYNKELYKLLDYDNGNDFL